jgi:hypothetical protein
MITSRVDKLGIALSFEQIQPGAITSSPDPLSPLLNPPFVHPIVLELELVFRFKIDPNTPLDGASPLARPQKLLRVRPSWLGRQHQGHERRFLAKPNGSFT